jgi:hypothetical protein
MSVAPLGNKQQTVDFSGDNPLLVVFAYHAHLVNATRYTLFYRASRAELVCHFHSPLWGLT